MSRHDVDAAALPSATDWQTDHNENVLVALPPCMTTIVRSVAARYSASAAAAKKMTTPFFLVSTIDDAMVLLRLFFLALVLLFLLLPVPWFFLHHSGVKHFGDEWQLLALMFQKTTTQRKIHTYPRLKQKKESPPRTSRRPRQSFALSDGVTVTVLHVRQFGRRKK